VNKHDAFVEELYDRVKDNYDVVHRNVTLVSTRGRKVGEIDLMGVKGQHTDVFEVKCSPRYVKARKQLKRIRKHVKGDIDTYFYCGSSKRIEEIEKP